MRAQVFGWSVLAACLAGCNGSDKSLYARLQDEDPAVRATAARSAGELRDRKAVPYLIDRLTDSERDVRLFSVLALRKITGLNKGYLHYAPATGRAKAERRWRDWLEAGRKDPTTAPAQGTDAK